MIVVASIRAEGKNAVPARHSSSCIGSSPSMSQYHANRLLDVGHRQHDVVESSHANHAEMLGSRPVIAGADFDHVAVAAERWADAWPRYVGELGGVWVAGGPDPGFASAQVRFANGMRLEVLEPHEPEHNDFLRRFLDRNGPGPHHLTFKVPDLADALEKVDAAGYRPVGVNLEHAGWKEAFLHPKDGPGVVIQLAQSSGSWSSPAPADLPGAQPAQTRRRSTASCTRSPASTKGFACSKACSAAPTIDAGEDDDRTLGRSWRGPDRAGSAWRRRVRRRARSASGWEIGSGRIHHLAFTSPGTDGPHEIAPDDNFGVRLLLSPG